MDTENFILSRAQLMEELQRRRTGDLDEYPLHIMKEYGIRLPAWGKLIVSFMTRGGTLSRVMEMGLPLVVPFLLRKQAPTLERWIQRIFPSKS